MLDEFSLDFVNKGKPFKMPKWTVAKHEELLEKMIEYDKKLESGEIKQKDYDKIYRATMMLLSLKEIDDTVTMEHLDSMHPDDFIELWTAIYLSGKKGIRANSDFQKGE